MSRIILALLCLLLAGCLTTPRPVFDATNSVAAEQSPAFMAFVESWEARAGNADSPRELIEDGARVVEIDGQALVQEPKADGSAEYYLLGRLGGRPIACAVNDVGIESLAAAHGVRLRIDRSEERPLALPAPIHADGEDAALYGFILAAFAEAALSCSSVATGG